MSSGRNYAWPAQPQSLESSLLGNELWPERMGMSSSTTRKSSLLGNELWPELDALRADRACQSSLLGNELWPEPAGQAGEQP